MRLLVVYLMGITWAIYSYSNVFFMFAPYLALRGFPSELTGILVGSFYAATTLIRPLGGWIVERAGIRRALILSALVCLIAGLFKFLTISFWPLLMIRLLMGSAFGIFVVALTTYQALVIPEEIRGLAFAMITLGSLSCLFTVVPMADWLLAHNQVTLFLAAPVVMAALCVVLSFSLPPLSEKLRSEGVREWGTWGDLYRETPFWRTVTSCTLFGLCDASIVYIPTLALAMGLIPSSFIVANGLGALMMRTLWHDFFNRHPRYMFAGPSLFVMAVFLYFTAEATNNIWLFVCGFLYGTGMGYGFPAHLALTGDLAPARLRAKMSALVHFCYDASWFILPVYVGFASRYIQEMGAFRILALVCIVSGIGVTLMWRQYSKSLRVSRI